jgi:hypothetical protein
MAFSYKSPSVVVLDIDLAHHRPLDPEGQSLVVVELKALHAAAIAFKRMKSP